MELRGSASIFLGLLVGFGVVCSSEAYRFYVGGREGWVENPKEGYNEWAGRARFSVNDTLCKFSDYDMIRRRIFALCAAVVIPLLFLV